MKIKIGKLASMTDTQVVTIRYYEKEGLLGAPDRSSANYRLYGEEDVERLNFIKHCRKHDMSLSEIRDLLAYRDSPKADCIWINAMIERHIRSVEERMASLAHLKEHLEKLLLACSGETPAEGCGIIRTLSDINSCSQCREQRCGHTREGNSLNPSLSA